MRILLNTLWIIFGGFISAMMWLFYGLIWCVTIVGIPVGLQCFKLASMSFNPFGKQILYDNSGATSFLLNVIWFLTSGLWMAIVNCVIGVILCITIIGIPFGKQFFKLASLSLRPFGARVERVHFF
ncbi:MAG: YccF domain-containing protein [Erysipelotrichaceae bacterium]|nr:YccF domain-containing protein [Erysipelotrichaceae bacterium]